MRISDWSSDVCSSDLAGGGGADPGPFAYRGDRESCARGGAAAGAGRAVHEPGLFVLPARRRAARPARRGGRGCGAEPAGDELGRTSSEQRRVGKEWVSTFSSRWSPYHDKITYQSIKCSMKVVAIHFLNNHP